jgi:hypothetical protein
MPIQGVDYSSARPDPDGLYADGYRFAGRYVGMGSRDKRLSPDEALALARAGLSIVALCEDATRDPLKGYRRGQTHATAALMEAAHCAMPPGSPIYFAVDFDVTDSELDDVFEYFAGIGTVMPVHTIGVYGGYHTVRSLMDADMAKWGFQTYAWSGGKVATQGHIYQYRNHVSLAGGQVDLCLALQDTYGQWYPTTFDRKDVPPAMSTAQDVWDADTIPVGGDPNNTTWQAKNALGYAVDLLKALRVEVTAVRGQLAAIAEHPAALSQADRDALVAAVVSELTTRVTPAPSAEAVASALLAQIHIQGIT